MGESHSLGTLLTILAPLIGVPLTVIIFYLRSLRDQQHSQLADLGRRVELLDESIRRACSRLGEVERDYTNKEEWLREAMWSRDRIEKISTAVAALQADHEGIETLLATSQRSARMIRGIHQKLSVRNAARAGGPDDVPIVTGPDNIPEEIVAKENR